MFDCYIRSDPYENPEVIKNLTDTLSEEGLSFQIVDVDWKDILAVKPFLWFRNAYIRFSDYRNVLELHRQNVNVPFTKSPEREVISVNPTATGTIPLTVNRNVYYHRPSVEPLPILIGTHCRPIYFLLTLNSILATMDPQQKIYLVLSQPDPETLEIAKKMIGNYGSIIEAVICFKNLKYSFANFGSKFFNLSKFIHYEDDGLLPENINWQMPFWTRQMAYRATTADLAFFRVSEINWGSSFYKTDIWHKQKLPDFKHNQLWHYSKNDPRYITPVGGWLVLDAIKHYQNFTEPNYCSSDSKILSGKDQVLCMANTPIYHIGANQQHDYPEYFKTRFASGGAAVDRLQTGVDLKTNLTKTIDLGVDFKV